MNLGTAVHLALLEPDRYLRELRIGPADAPGALSLFVQVARIPH